MPTFNDPNAEPQDTQLQPRFQPFSVAEEMMSPADQQLGNEVGMLMQAQRDRKLEDDYFQAVRDNANMDEETRFALADRYFAERYGIETHHGAIINSGSDYKMKPFESVAAYENALVTLAEKGYEGIASERYRNLMAAERLGDAAATKAEIIKQAQIATEEDVDDLSTPNMMTPGVVTYQKIRRPRRQEDIDRDVDDYRANVLGENFVALFEHFRPDLSEDGERIVRAFVKNGSLPVDEEHAFKSLYAADQKQGELVKFLAEQAKETEYGLNGAAGRGMAAMMKQIINGAGEKIGQGLYRFGAGLDAMDYAWTGSNADRISRMNRDERDEYERLRAEGIPEPKALDAVSSQMQRRFLDEMLSPEDRSRSRRVELALKDLMAKREWEHYGYWENAYIGAATTIPYMGITAIPYAGFAVNVFSHMQDVEDQIIREGGDPTKAQAARAIGAVTWAAIEKMELKGWGRSLTRLEKTVMWRHLWKGQMKLALGELGTAAKIGGKDLLINWIKETGQEGLQGAIESIETDLGLDREGATIVKNALKRTWDDAKDSAGTMAIISTVFPIAGAVARIPFQRRRMQERESVIAYITRQEQLKNMLQGTIRPEPETPEMRTKRVTKAYDEIQNVWDASATPQVAMEKYQEMGYTEDEAVKIAEYFDMRAEILRNAAYLPEDQGLRDAMIAGNAFRVGQDTTYNPADLFHIINANIVTEEVEVPTPGEADAAPQKALRVTVPMKDANGAETTRVFTVVEDSKAPDIEAPTFASSVAEASKGTDFETTAEEYLSMDIDAKAAFLLANGLKHGGDFRVLDQDGQTIFSSDALIQLARANSSFVRKGGNWTLAHETAHGIVAFARQMGIFEPDADTTKVMVKLFGGPTNDKEAWNEESMANAFAEYLRGQYDFKRLSRDERGIVERVFDAVIDFFKTAYYRLTGKAPDPAAVELKAREQAMDAVFEGIRSGDFSGLSAYAGIDFAEDRQQDTAQDAQERPDTASAAKTNNEPPAPKEAVPAAPAAVSAPSAVATSAEERVKQAHAARKGVKVPQATPTQAQIDRIQAKLAAVTADPKGAAASVPTPRKAPKGEETRATPQGGVKFKIAWQWIPRAELVTSDKAEYPQEFQPRDRASRVASDLQVIENTRPGRFDPMKLAYSYDSDGGAPIVAGGNVVLSGNGRSMMLGQLAREGRYDDYLAKISDWADEYGIGRPPAGMKEPVLVQRITSTERREDLLKIAELSNQAKILTRSEAENAEADAKLITSMMMRLFRPSEDGDLQVATNADFMQAFIAAAPDAKGLTNADGTPTDQAVRRVQNALLSAVLGQDQTTRALLKTLLEKRGDLGLGDLYRALIKSSGALLSNRTTKASFDLLPHIRRAVGQYVSWRSARLSNPRYTLEEHLRTRDMFAAAPSKETEAVTRLLEAGRFGRVLDKYNELVAQKAPDAQASFFAEDTAYQTLAKAERAVLLDGETPVTLDPADAIAAEPLQAPPAEVTPAPVAVEPEPAPALGATDTPAPAVQEAETFEPQPVRRGTATIPTQNAEKIVAYQVNADGQPTTAKRVLPVGAYNLLRAPYDVRKPPEASVQDKAGRGLGIGIPAPATGADGRYWGKIFPHFQGNKTEMADRTSQAIRKLMPKAERESYKTVVDYFGGGGCWGLYHALTNFPNADRLVINEWEQGRIAKIRLLHEKGAAVADEAAKLITEDLYAELKKACMVGDGNTESGSGTTIASKLEPMAERYRNDDYKLGLIYTVVDCARTMLANRTDAAGRPSFDTGFDAVIKNLREDGRKAQEAADAFKARGGAITYRQGDAANYADAPAGADVVAVCDPPYYLTAGYNGQVSVPMDANGMGWDYKTTRRMLEGLVDKGDAIVYTDEAWWFKENYTPDQQEDLFGGGSPFAQEQGILLGIINALDHFDVAGRVVGRQEVLGINHGHKTADGRAEGVSHASRAAGADAEGAADGRGVQGNHPGDALGGMAAGAQGQDGGLLGDGAGRGHEGDAESVALAREVAAVQIEEAAADAGVQVTPQVARIVRASVRQVREDRILDYAKTVSKNAKAWIYRQRKAIDRRMAEHGYTDKVWHGTEGNDFNAFQFSSRSHTVSAAYFTYNRGTAENYAALRSMDVENLDEAKPNVREYYVNPGNVLDIDEGQPGQATSFDGFKALAKKAYEDGYDSIRVRNTYDDQGFRFNGDETPQNMEYPTEEHDVRTDILIVFDHPGNPGANRIKAADPVTFMDDTGGALPIPLAMRADQSIPDVRYSVAMGNRAREEARAMLAKYRPDVLSYTRFVDGEIVPDVNYVVDQIAAFDTPKERKAALFWFCKDAIRLPDDRAKVVDAIKTAEKAKVDPFQFERPGELLEKYAKYRPGEPPTDPDTVPELSDRRDMGHGIVTYLVQDDQAGQAAMRQIINTHLGKDASPWCLLQGDGNGGLSTSAWSYWQQYNALPKRVAFKDGKLCAFMATDDRVQPTSGEDGKPRARDSWWNRADEPHDGIPFTRPVPAPSGEGANATEHAELMPNGEVRVFKTTRGNPKDRIGRYEEWFPDGAYKLWADGKGRDYHFEFWVDGLEMEHSETFYDQHIEIIRSPDGSVRDAVVRSEEPEYPFMMRYGTFHNELVIRQADGEAFISEGTPIGADDFVEIAKGVYSALKRNDTDAVDSFVADLKRRCNSGEGPRFSVRVKEPPKRTGIGYKVFFQKNGKLYPPMVANPNGADTPVGVWLDADAAPVAGESKTGRPQVRQGGKGTQGGSGMLAYRPGWHLGMIPYALQFNRRDENGEKTLFPADFVWAEVEYAADMDYQREAEAEGMTANGKFRHSYAGLKRLPTDGFYTYRTNPNPETDPWIITGAMKVNRILTRDEVDEMVRNAGREPQRVAPRFSVARVNPDLAKDVRTAIAGDADGKPVGRRREVTFSEMPDALKAVGIPDLPIRTRTDIVRKLRRNHGFTERQIVALPEAYGQPAAVFLDDKAYVVLTGMRIATRGGSEKPVMVVLRESVDRNGRHEFLASAYPREESNENFYEGLARNGKMLFLDKNKVAVIGLNGRTISTLNEQADGNRVKTPEDVSSVVSGGSMPNSGADVNGGAAPRLRDHGVARAETEAERSSMRHSVFVGAKGARRIDQQRTLEDAVGILADKFGGSYTDAARDLIYRKTGWWKGVDGLWRYEIRDFRTKKCGETVKYLDSDEYAMENGLRRYTDIDAQWCRLTDMVTHTTLFRAYPMLKDIVVDIVDPDETDFDGTYDPAGNRITLTWDAVEWFDDAPSNVLTSDGLGTLTHEIQHAVQYIEDFAKGGTPEENGKRNYERLAGEVEARNASRRRGGIFWDLTHGKSKGNDLRRLAASGSTAPWNTEDVPSRRQIIADEYGSMTDVNGKRVTRHSARRGKRPMKAEDVAAGFLAARFLAGKETSVEDAARLLKNVGLRVDAPAMLERAKDLAERNRDRLRAGVEAKSPEVIAALANASLRDRATEAFNTAITTGAAAADPDIGVSMQRTADRFAARELQAAKGFTAAQMQAELPISLADAVFAVAEYEKTPEEKARLEELKKRRDEEKAAAEEARMADPDAETPVEEAERLARDTSYREPSAEERAYFDQLMDRTRFADEARAQEELRQKLAEKKKAEDNADNDDAEGNSDDKSKADAILPFDTVKRIAPVFESAELFAQFVVEWTTDHILKRHPELATREDLWKSPVAVKELVKTAQHILRDLAKQTLGSPSISAARNYVDQAIINLADYKTFRAIRRNVAHIYDRIHDNALRFSRRKLVNELIYGRRDSAEDGPGFKGLRALAGIKGRFSATTEKDDRAIDAKTELWCRWLIPYLTMTEERMQAEEDRLKAIIARHDTEDAEYGYNKEDNTQYAEAKDRLALLNVYGGMVRWMPGKIIDAREQILEQVNGKRQAFEQARAKREAEDKAIRDAIIAAVEAGASDGYRHHSEFADRMDRILYSMNGNLTLEMQNLIRFCKDPAKREAALLAIEDLAVIISRGTERHRVTLAQARKEVNDGLAACYGNAEAGIRHLMHDQVPVDAARRIFTQSRDKVQTYGQLLQLYASTLQADYKDNAQKHGRAANLALMEQTLTSQDIAFHAWAVNWYAANREALNDAVEEITGLGVSSPDRLYCPARMDRDPDGFTADAVAWSPIPSALNRRVSHGLDFSEAANFLTCVMEQAEIRAQTIGYGMTGIRLRDIIAHHELQKAVRKHVGRADMRLVTDHIKDVLVQGAAKKDAIEWLAPLNFARKWMARFYLSGNVPSAIKQLSSMPVWANAMLGGQEIGLMRCLGYLTSVGTEEGRQALEDLIKSDGFRARYQMGWSEEIQNLLANPSKNRLVRYFEKACDKGMLVNKGVDAVSCLWMAQGFYRDAKALFERRGFTPEKAKENALALTWSVCENGQQSGRIENMNRAQRHGGALVSAVFQFKTAFLLQNNYIIQAIRDVRAGTPGAKGRLARGLFINAVYIPAFVAVVNAVWGAVMGDKEPPEDPDKAPQWLKDFAWSMIDGVTAPLFLTGSIIHAAFNQIFGKTGYDDNASLPAVEGIMRVGKHAGKAIADTIALITPMDVAKEVTPEKVREDLLRLAADIAAPVRHVRRAIKNREE